MEIETDPDGNFPVHEESFVMQIYGLSPGCSFSDIWSKRQELSWLVCTRPDLTCAVNVAAQVSKDKFSQQEIISIIKVVSSAKRHHRRGLVQQNIDLETL